MNENTLFEGIILNPIERTPFGNTARDYENTKKIHSVEELEKQESLHSQMRTYQVPAEILNSFLVSKFGHNLTDLMRLYCKTHFERTGLNTTDNDIDLIVGIHYIPANVVCFLEEATDAEELAIRLYNYQATVIENSLGRTQLNLHDDTVRKFTLIRANFDLETEKKRFNYGYHFSTERFRFFIKSSAQFDLSIVYEEL